MDKDIEEQFTRLYGIIARLRNPEGGCPWDIEQTPMTLRSTILEETYETIEAIEEVSADPHASAHVAEELGDVMLNVMMIAYMFEQEEDFSVADMLRRVNEKLVRRHPHVFGQTEGFNFSNDAEKPSTAETVLAQWDIIKEKVEGRAAESVLDSVPKHFPPLLRAAKLQKKAAKKGFDWDSIDEVWKKIDEELGEFRAAIAEHDTAHIEEEFGDVLFAFVNLARHLHINSSLALTGTNNKFERRFRFVEQKMHEKGIPCTHENLAQMDSFWNEAKQVERHDAST
ncbi:MAG: nucleoside triphosphate pyrophosphohydrolase [Treponema sp.]